jgi:MYXO-CTERM domain-containing protein
LLKNDAFFIFGMWVARRIRVCINYYSSSNDLWVHLLDGAPADLERYRDNKNEAVDAFAGQGVLLNHWQDLPAWPQDITYTFDATDLDALVSYLLDGSVGFGFDPDCHFYNSGISFMVETTPVPAPASFGLLGMGFVGLLGLSRRRRKK